MNQNIEKLYRIAQKPSRHIIGLMSGTSLDGLDVALCRLEGEGEDTKIELVNFETVDYSESVKSEIREIFAKQTIDFQHLTLLNACIGKLHGNMILSCLEKWGLENKDVDLVASHGQTVFHAPKILHKIDRFDNATLQIGDGDHVAVTTGIITVSDFRQKHVAAGGEGAPLAVYGDYFIFSKKDENRILLNMGGIANFTYLPGSLDASEVFVTDTGPGNTLLDAFTRKYYPNLAYDKDAALSKQGKIIPELLRELKANEFFQQPFPKTTGPELFNIPYVENAIQCGQLDTPLMPSASSSNGMTVFDTLATLTRFSAETIAEAIKKSFTGKQIDGQFTIYTSGGGAHNPLLIKHLRELLPDMPLKSTNDLGINGDAKEAILFAILANECVAGGHTDFGKRAGVPSVSMGKISFPN
jgi:anhydro-N-acetylmuramic acid kinase